MPTTGAVTSGRPGRLPLARSATTTSRRTRATTRSSSTKYGIGAELTATAAHRLAALHVPGDAARPTCCSTPAGRTCSVLRPRDPRRRRPHGRGLGRRRRLLRRPRRAPATSSARSSTARSPRYGTWRDATLTPGSRTRDDGAGANGGWVTFDATTHQAGRRSRSASPTRAPTAPGRTSPRRPASRASTSTPSAAPRTTAGQTMLAQGDDRRRHGPTAASPTTPRSTTRSCTRTSLGDVDGAYMGFDGKVHTASGLHADGELLAVGHLPHRRTSCSSCSRRRSRATSRCRCSRSGARAAGCRAGRWRTARPTS